MCSLENLRMRLANITLNKVSRARKKVQLGTEDRILHIMKRTVTFTRFFVWDTCGIHTVVIGSCPLMQMSFTLHIHPLDTYFL